jgi:hypothetical protein
MVLCCLRTVRSSFPALGGASVLGSDGRGLGARSVNDLSEEQQWMQSQVAVAA